MRWPGRFEVFVEDGKTVVLDGAHNPDGAQKFSDALRDFSRVSGLGHGGWTMVIGIMGDKEISPMLS